VRLLERPDLVDAPRAADAEQMKQRTHLSWFEICYECGSSVLSECLGVSTAHVGWNPTTCRARSGVRRAQVKVAEG
jgi:hypothetical protein